MAGLIGKTLMAAGVALSLGGSAVAADMAKGGMEGVTIYTAKAEFEDVRFALENAIINRGLVIDYTSHIGEMLDRTGSDVGGKKTIFSNAQSMLFCSAVLSRAAMEADPLNLAYCPYAVFVYETPDAPGSINVGFRHLSETGSDASKKAIADVNALLDEIVTEAADQE